MKKAGLFKNPAWLPAGAYLGLAVLVGIMAAFIFWWTPKQEVRVGDFQPAPAVLVEANTGKVVYGELELQGSIEKRRFNLSASKFSGSLTVFPSYGVLSGCEAELEIPLSAEESAQQGEKAVFSAKTAPAFA